MRPANKSALADAIWVLMPKDVVGPTGQSQYVLDGGPWCTEYRGSGVQPTMTYVDCTQTTSQEDMDMPLLCSTGTRKNSPRNVVLMNAAQWISHGILS